MYASFSRSRMNTNATTNQLVGREVTVTDGGGKELTGTVEAVNIVNDEVARVKVGNDWYDSYRPAS